MLSRRVKFTFRGIFLRSIRVPLIQSVAEQNILYFLNLTFVKAVGEIPMYEVLLGSSGSGLTVRQLARRVWTWSLLQIISPVSLWLTVWQSPSSRLVH